MLVWEQILEDFRNGVETEDIRRKYRSQSQLVKAFRVYVDELINELKNLEKLL